MPTRVKGKAINLKINDVTYEGFIENCLKPSQKVPLTDFVFPVLPVTGSIRARSIYSRIIKPFAFDFGLSEFALYERQRALVRAGLLRLQGGRGPGGGIPATSRNVAIWLLGVLTAEAYAQVGATKNLKELLRQKGVCPLTGASNPLGAVEALLTSPPDMRSPLALICVTNSASMFLADKRGGRIVQWGQDLNGLMIEARISVALLRTIAAAVLHESDT
jgi:hypothetical protein